MSPANEDKDDPDARDDLHFGSSVRATFGTGSSSAFSSPSDRFITAIFCSMRDEQVGSKDEGSEGEDDSEDDVEVVKVEVAVVRFADIVTSACEGGPDGADCSWVPKSADA